MMRGPGLARPGLIIVHDYQVSRDEVQLDNGIGSRIERLVQGTPDQQDRAKLEQSVARIGTTTLVEEIRKLGLRAEPGAAAGHAATSAAVSAGIGLASALRPPNPTPSTPPARSRRISRSSSSNKAGSLRTKPINFSGTVNCASTL